MYLPWWYSGQLHYVKHYQYWYKLLCSGTEVFVNNLIKCGVLVSMDSALQ